MLLLLIEVHPKSLESGKFPPILENPTQVVLPLWSLSLFLAVLALHCCVWVFSSCGSWVSLVAEHGL